MEGKASRLLRGLVAALGAAVMLVPATAWAQTAGSAEQDHRDLGAEVSVSANSQAFVVEGEQVGTTIPTTGSGVKKGNLCRWTRMTDFDLTKNADAGLRESDSRSTLAADRPDPRAIGYFVTCGMETHIRWVVPKPPAPNPAPAPPKDAREAALQFRDEVPMPNVTLQMTPSSWGLCNMESWFWVGGWDGAPITWSTTTPWGTQVDLEATPLSYRWDFGDGTVVTTASFGRPYPAEAGAVKHAYRTKNLTGYPVTVHFVFKAKWRENGGAWNEDVPAIERTATVAYPVHEIRSVVVERG